MICLIGLIKKQLQCSDDGAFVPDMYEDEGIASCTISSHSIRMDIAQPLVRFITGKGGIVLQNIHADTGAIMTVGKPSKTGLCPVVIKGPNEDVCISARTRVDLALQEGINASPVTHFISIPLLGAELQENTRKLYDEMWKSCRNVDGFDRSLFLDTEHLHLTITVLKLFSEDDIQRASAVLKTLQGYLSMFMGKEPPRILLKGLEYMNDDPSKVDVLYAQVQDLSEGRKLKRICDETIRHFQEANLFVDERDLKIHATILNTAYRARQGSERIPFDARPILEQFGDYYLGSVPIHEMILAKRGDFEIVAKCRFSE
eukprot:TRINITY_DN5630_c0_g1_i6.p1 TRINITY_DN5630_c0_g1~~TRINITY_DN5630_c0_g1_i6.p1  ORF type:complete len:316 (-),score=66.41 TRINITY_DN5630_c0_g1_i6:16-963(-)